MSFNRDFDDWADDEAVAQHQPALRQTAEEQRRKAHVANGGDNVQMVDCPKCRGSGMTRWGRCFRCQTSKVAGKVTMRSAAASKASATRKENDERRRDEFQENHAAEIRYVGKRADKGSAFYESFRQKIAEWGYLTENQLAVVQKDMAKDQAFWEAKREAERKTNKVNVSAIEALFAKAVENDVKKPIFRGAEVTLKQAPASGKNPGALYVTRTIAGKSADGEYLGKIVGGQFHAFGSDGAATLQKLLLVAEDPDKEAIRYASKFSACGICGTAVVNPVSIRSVIGPICARKWGLTHLRDAAEEDLKKEKAAEQAARERGEII